MHGMHNMYMNSAMNRVTALYLDWLQNNLDHSLVQVG